MCGGCGMFEQGTWTHSLAGEETIRQLKGTIELLKGLTCTTSPFSENTGIARE